MFLLRVDGSCVSSFRPSMGVRPLISYGSPFPSATFLLSVAATARAYAAIVAGTATRHFAFFDLHSLPSALSYPFPLLPAATCSGSCRSSLRQRSLLFVFSSSLPSLTLLSLPSKCNYRVQPFVEQWKTPCTSAKDPQVCAGKGRESIVIGISSLPFPSLSGRAAFRWGG